ncbi:MAG: M56 family metallopeptidase [Flavonifractor plautii]
MALAWSAAAAAAGHRRLAGLCADGLVVGERPHPHRLRVRVLYPPCVRSRRGGGETLRWVLLHERAHIKLGHHRYKAVYFLLAGLHWFNPMLWLSWVLLGRDLEVACDEKVLGSACGSPREYSAALLALASPNRGPLLPPGFGETGVKDRIRRALKWKPAAPWMAAVLFVLAVALGLLAAQ